MAQAGVSAHSPSRRRSAIHSGHDKSSTVITVSQAFAARRIPLNRGHAGCGRPAANGCLSAAWRSIDSCRHSASLREAKYKSPECWSLVSAFSRCSAFFAQPTAGHHASRTASRGSLFHGESGSTAAIDRRRNDDRRLGPRPVQIPALRRQTLAVLVDRSRGQSGASVIVARRTMYRAQAIQIDAAWRPS